MHKILLHKKMAAKNIILGSQSPRRKFLLAELGLKFDVKPIKTDENYPLTLFREHIAVFLSKKKADAYPKNLSINDILITSDTIVWLNNEVLNKPVDYADAKYKLTQLSGNKHEVITGVTITSATKQISFCSITEVWFKKLSNDEIDYYLINHKPYDKAGSYGVQEWIGYVGIEQIHGSFYNVMGLPTQALYDALLNF